MTLVGDQGSHLLYIPDVVLVPEAFHRFTSFRIAPVRQLAVAMNGVVAPALQLVAHGSLAGAGKALDEVVPPAHVRENTHPTWAIRHLVRCRPRYSRGEALFRRTVVHDARAH